jgi:MoaA/NifB/PqqE/SkfB family radical SAM enzyme
MIEQVKGWLSNKIFGISLYIDIIDNCQCKCPSCPSGTQKRMDGHTMTIEEFDEILIKLLSETQLRKVQLYRWGDPTLHPDLHLFIQRCRQYHLPCSISTVAQKTRCDWDKVVEARPDEIRFSFTGWKYMSYYQWGAKASTFTLNVEKISSLPRHPETRWTMFYHLYRDNLDEEIFAKKFAKDCNLEFFSFPATYMMYENIVSGKYPAKDKEILSRLLETPEQNIARFKKKPKETDYCIMQSKQLTLNSYGKIYQCQMMYNSNVGNFLNMSYQDSVGIRKREPYCLMCKAKGVPGYAQIFADPIVVDDPIEKANKGRYDQI